MAKRPKKPEPALPPDTAYRALPTHLQKLVDLLPLNEQVHRDIIFKAYGNSNYARRIRKIQSEYGWLIERVRGTKGANDDYYIRRSDGPVLPQRIRYEVAPKVRLQIYERDEWTCQMCGAFVGEGQSLSRPQSDHKIPADRGGNSSEENLQTLCLQCNLKKRQACKHCTLPTCTGCPYAFPEHFDNVFTLRLPYDSASKLKAEAKRQGVSPAEVIGRLLVSLPPNADAS